MLQEKHDLFTNHRILNTSIVHEMTLYSSNDVPTAAAFLYNTPRVQQPRPY